MPRNIEIKARMPDRAAVEARAAALAHAGPELVLQDDTFFGGATGRIKLRTLSPGAGELIAYRRADASGPKTSSYLIAPTTEPDRLREVLARAYGLAGRVRKARTLYLAGRTRIHLDRVEGLGDWLELEVVLQDGEDESGGVAEAHALMAALGVAPSQCVEGAYVDLLAAQARTVDGGGASDATVMPPEPIPPSTTPPATTTTTAPTAVGDPLAPWRVTATRRLVHDRWLTLRADTCEVPGGPVLDPYYVLEERDWVHAFALDEAGRVLIVHQYRHAAGVVTAELPGGVVDAGESPLAAARRELREETGREAADWLPAGTVWANPARQTNRVHVFVARGLGPVLERRLDDGERIVVDAAPPERIRCLIADGRFSQGLHIALFHLGLDAARDAGWLPAGAAPPPSTTRPGR